MPKLHPSLLALTLLSIAACFPPVSAQQAYLHDIYLMNADGSGKTKLTDGSAQIRQPAWSPDGKYIAFSSDKDGSFDIWIISADGSELRKLTSDQGADELGACWSADGKSIIYNSAWGKLINARLASITVEEGTLTPIDSPWGPLIDPDLADDGNTLVAIRARTETEVVFDLVTGSVSGDLNPLVNVDTNAFLSEPKWDRGANRIIARAAFASLGDIYLIDVRSGEATPVVEGPYEERDPDWAPNGNQIVFASDREGSLDLYTHTLNSGATTPLTSTPDIDEVEPAWSPDGRKIAFVAISQDPAKPAVAEQTIEGLARAGRFLPEIATRPSVWKSGAVWHSRKSIGYVLLGRNGELIGGPTQNIGANILYTIPSPDGFDLYHSGPKWDGVYARVDKTGAITLSNAPQRAGVPAPPQPTYGSWTRLSADGSPSPLAKDEIIFPAFLSSVAAQRPTQAIGWALALTGGQLYIPDQSMTPPPDILWLVRAEATITIVESGPARSGVWATVSPGLLVSTNDESGWDQARWNYIDEFQRPTIPPPGRIVRPGKSSEELITVLADGSLFIPGRAVE